MIRKLGALLALLATTLIPLSAEPLSVDRLYDEAQFIGPKLSPDGKSIAVVLQKDGKQWLTRIELATMKPEPLAFLDDTKLSNQWWKGDDFMFLLVTNSDESRDFRSYNLRTKKEYSPKSLKRRGVWLLHPLPDDPNDVIVAAQVGAGFDLCRLNVRTGNLTVLEKSPRYVTQWIVNHRGEAVVAIGNQDKRDFFLWRSAPGAPWERRDLGPEAHPDLRIAAVHPDQRRLIAWDFTAEGPARAVALDPATMQQELIFADKEVDPDNVEHWGDDPTLPCAISYETDRPRLHFLNPQAEALQASVDDALPGTTNRIASLSTDGQVMLVRSTSDREPGLYYVLDRRQKRLGVLGTQFVGIEASKLLPSRRIKFTARDGLTIFGRLTLPAPGPTRPPLIVLTPPEFAGSRNRGDFDLLAQFFATRGFAVARFDHRGTNGYGRAFLKAGDFQISEGMPQDIEDGVRWLVAERLVDERRTVLFGEQAGGVVAIHALANSGVFTAWINWNTPVHTRDFGYQNLAMFPRERSEAIGDLGGRREAARYRASIDPKPLISKIKVPSFHVYSRWSGADDMEGLLTQAPGNFTFVRQKRYESREVIVPEMRNIFSRMAQFLDDKVMKTPATATP